MYNVIESFILQNIIIIIIAVIIIPMCMHIDTPLIMTLCNPWPALRVRASHQVTISQGLTPDKIRILMTLYIIIIYM